MSSVYTEIQNQSKRVGVQHVKMTCDSRPDSLPSVLQWHFFSILSGTCGSGKTNLLMSLIAQRKKNYYKQFDKIFIFSPSLNTVSKKIHLPDEQLIPSLDMDILDEIIAQQEEDNSEDVLIIIDDLVSSIVKNSKALLRLIYNRRHLNCSIFITTQKYNKISLDLRTAASSIYLFKVSNKAELRSIKDEIGIGLDEDQFQELLVATYKKPYDFLYVKLDSGEYYRNFNKLIKTRVDASDPYEKDLES
jgi:hypothetical protein